MEEEQEGANGRLKEEEEQVEASGEDVADLEDDEEDQEDSASSSHLKWMEEGDQSERSEDDDGVEAEQPSMTPETLLLENDDEKGRGSGSSKKRKSMVVVESSEEEEEKPWNTKEDLEAFQAAMGKEGDKYCHVLKTGMNRIVGRYGVFNKSGCKIDLGWVCLTVKANRLGILLAAVVDDTDVHTKCGKWVLLCRRRTTCAKSSGCYKAIYKN